MQKSCNYCAISTGHSIVRIIFWLYLENPKQDELSSDV